MREKSKSLHIIQNAIEQNTAIYEWLTWNKDTLEGTFVNLPQRIQIPEKINEQFIVELYSK